jgi:hypothetical protein
MAGNAVEIIINAVDKASATLNKVSREIGGMEKTGKSAGTSLMSNFGGIAKSFLGAVAPALSVGTALVAVSKVVSSSINDWTAYNEEVRKLGVATGTSTEDLSRMMQAADDLGISMDSMRTAMMFASKNGVKPTIENIARLSDELLAITDTTERAKKMQEVFGRGYAEVAGFVLQGSESIKAGTAAISDSLVVTSKSATETREYMKAVDDLGDAWTSVKNVVGGATIPVLTVLLKKVYDLIDATEEASHTEEEEAKAIEEVTSASADLTFAKKQLSDGTIITTKEILGEVVAVEILDGVMRNAQTGALIPMTDAEILLYKQTINVKEAMFDAVPALDGMVKQVYNLRDGAMGAIPALAAMLDPTRELARETKKFTDGINTDALKEYSKQLLYNKAAANMDANAAFELALRMGLVDERTVIATRELQKLNVQYDLNRDGIISNNEATDEYIAKVQNLNFELSNLPESGTFNFYIKQHGSISLPGSTNKGSGTGTGGTGGGGGTGGNTTMLASGTPPGGFMVPPGYPNDSYRVGLSSGEHVYVSPKGKDNAPVNSFTLNINNPVRTPEDIVSSFALLQALAGAL